MTHPGYMQTISLKRLSITLILTVLAFALDGCKPRAAEPTQVVARIDSEEITVHQLNLALAKLQRKDISKKERDAVLETMVDRQLLQRQSQLLKLDRRTEVMARLEEARHEIMAAAYVEELAGKLPPIDEETAAKYYGEHPSLFAQRRIYRLREITIPEEKPMNSATINEVLIRLRDRERIPSLLAWLRQQPGRFYDQLLIRPAEDLPVNIADELGKLAQGAAFPSRQPEGLVIYEVQGFEAAPLTWATAVPSIKSFLKTQQAAAAVVEELKRLRAAATITMN